MWTGTQRAGYGSFWLNGNSIGAHRYIWETQHGPVPKGMCICHQCDVRRCVNPEHLFLGTPKDNTQDMVTKRRGISGERHPLSKLTSENVITIRARWSKGAKQNHLATEFGVSTSMIFSIVHGHRWKGDLPRHDDTYERIK